MLLGAPILRPALAGRQHLRMCFTLTRCSQQDLGFRPGECRREVPGQATKRQQGMNGAPFRRASVSLNLAPQPPRLRPSQGPSARNAPWGSGHGLPRASQIRNRCQRPPPGQAAHRLVCTNERLLRAVALSEKGRRPRAGARLSVDRRGESRASSFRPEGPCPA